MKTSRPIVKLPEHLFSQLVVICPLLRNFSNLARALLIAETLTLRFQTLSASTANRKCFNKHELTHEVHLLLLARLPFTLFHHCLPHHRLHSSETSVLTFSAPQPSEFSVINALVFLFCDKSPHFDSTLTQDRTDTLKHSILHKSDMNKSPEPPSLRNCCVLPDMLSSQPYSLNAGLLFWHRCLMATAILLRLVQHHWGFRNYPPTPAQPLVHRGLRPVVTLRLKLWPCKFLITMPVCLTRLLKPRTSTIPYSTTGGGRGESSPGRGSVQHLLREKTMIQLGPN